MIQYKLLQINAEELDFKLTPIKAAPNTQVKIPFRFGRMFRQAQNNPKINLVALECNIEGTEENPSPFTLHVRMVGAFEVENMNTDEDRRVFGMNATETVFPYLRAAITSLTATALITPLVPPVVPAIAIFPEDRGGGNYTINFDPKTIN